MDQLGINSGRQSPAEAGIDAVFAGKGFSLLSAENGYRISHYFEFVGRKRLTD
jgi:hypothetical protein